MRPPGNQHSDTHGHRQEQHERERDQKATHPQNDPPSSYVPRVMRTSLQTTNGARIVDFPDMPLNVCLLASEVAPLSKTGGLADVSGALAKFLHTAGHDVRLFTPLYSSIDRSKLSLRAIEFLEDVQLEVGPHRYRYSVLAGHIPGSTATIYLIDCPVLYSRATLYTTDVDEHLRFLVLTRAAFECCQRMRWSPSIVHCNDWHTAFAPLFLKAMYQLGSALRQHEVGAHDPQHRLSGHVRCAGGG